MPTPTPLALTLEAGGATGEYVGGKKLLIDGTLTEEEKEMLDAMGVREIEYDDQFVYPLKRGYLPCVDSSFIAFLGNDFYFYEKINSIVMRENKSNAYGCITFKPLRKDYPMLHCSNTGECCLIENEEELFKGTDLLDESRKHKIEGYQSGNQIEYVVKGLRSVIKKNIGNEFRIRTFGGDVRLKLSDI